MSEPSRMVERIIERTEQPTNGGFGRFKDVVFVAIFLGAGAVIWEQQQTIGAIERDVAVLKVVCGNQPVKRGIPSGQ